MHVIGDCIVRANAGKYRELYDARKILELEKLQGGKTCKIHAHKRAMRYMEKQLLRDLWVKWNE